MPEGILVARVGGVQDEQQIGFPELPFPDAQPQRGVEDFTAASADEVVEREEQPPRKGLVPAGRQR